MLMMPMATVPVPVRVTVQEPPAEARPVICTRAPDL